MSPDDTLPPDGAAPTERAPASSSKPVSLELYLLNIAAPRIPPPPRTPSPLPDDDDAQEHMRGLDQDD